MSESELKGLCQKLAGIHKSTVIAIVLPNESLRRFHLLEIQKLILGKTCNDLDVVIHSGGGDINAAYQIAELLRTHCKMMTTIIPLYAKSAATLFILASDRLIMGDLAEAGPLDTQIAEREKGGIKYTSALNPFKTLEELQKFALETLDVTAKLLLSRAELSVEEAIRHGMDLASRISTPLFSQLNAEKVGEYSRALAVGKEYGDRLLRRYTRWQDPQDRNDILERLIFHYPSHEYIIDSKELEELGFDVSALTKDNRPVMDAIVDYVLKSSRTEILCVDTRKRANDDKDETKCDKEETNDA